MNKYLKYLKALLFIIIPTFLLTFFISFLTYKGLINNTTNNYLIIFIVAISFFVSGLYLGNKTNKKGFLEGIKIGLSTILLFIILSLIFKAKFSITSLIYYFILLASSIIGSMIGISKKS